MAKQSLIDQYIVCVIFLEKDSFSQEGTIVRAQDVTQFNSTGGLDFPRSPTPLTFPVGPYIYLIAPSSFPNSVSPISLAKPSFFTPLRNPKKIAKKYVTPTIVSLVLYFEMEDRYSGGSILCFDSIKDSNVRQGNVRFWDNMDSNVRDKVWKKISKLGVVAKDKAKDYNKKIAEMERNDKERREISKAPKSWKS